ncbi:hypothetical protein CAPTEDRAFT_222492 [Capitella teleta]|uniref:Fibronectin type-III domain-containing protein n=1 Tax=Capitella teleta TaxID=283909 RepID=R7T515_CAPTE|nr:hypothetical protein CAPTEDRAFT_222492 [Capitella teleta]|eukprot:ELT88247.1 hypothetical protein CAPTEDRAFT_222492 [Capitella teleta]
MDEECSNLSTTTIVVDHSRSTLVLPPFRFIIDDCFVFCMMDGRVLNYEHIMVGYSPFEVQLRSIIYVNWQNVEITFSKQRNNTIFTTRYYIEYKNRNDERFLKSLICEEVVSSKFSCLLQNIGIKRFRFFKYRVLGENSVVKPGKIRNLNLQPFSSFSIGVCFEAPHPDCPPDAVYHLSLSNQFQDISLPITSSMSPICHNITSLLSFMAYNISLRPEILSSRFKGDVASCHFQMPESVPQRYPEVSPGAFEIQLRKPSVRNVIIYWQSVPKQFLGAEFKSYEVTQVSGTQMLKWYTNKTLYHFTDLLNNRDCVMFVQAVNEVGTLQGQSMTGILIPAQQNLVRQVQNLTAHVQSNKTEIHLNWTYDDYSTIKGFTVYHCKGILHCSSELRWQTVSRDEKGAVVHLPAQWAHAAKLIGVSVEDASSRSSGILWAPCFYSSTTRPQRPQFALLSVTKYSAKVEVISVVCEKSLEPSGYVYAYEVDFCASDGHMCIGVTTQQVIPRSNAGLLSIGGLTAGQQYMLWGRSLSVSGPSYYNSTEIMMQTDKEIFSNGFIAGLVMAGLVGLLCLVCGLYTCCRQGQKLWKAIKRKLTLDIRTLSRSQHMDNVPVNLSDLPVGKAVDDEDRYLMINNLDDGDYTQQGTCMNPKRIPDMPLPSPPSLPPPHSPILPVFSHPSQQFEESRFILPSPNAKPQQEFIKSETSEDEMDEYSRFSVQKEEEEELGYVGKEVPSPPSPAVNPNDAASLTYVGGVTENDAVSCDKEEVAFTGGGSILPSIPH